MGSLVQAAQTAYQEWKDTNPASITDWQSMTDAEVAAMFRQDQVYQQAIKDAQAIEDSFYAARTQAFADFESAHVAARSALQTTWQGYEDDMFTIPAGV